MKKHSKEIVGIILVLVMIALVIPRFTSRSFVEKRSAVRMMHAFYDKLVELKPLLFDREKFMSEGSAVQINEALMDLQDTVNQAQGDSTFEIPGYKITLDLMEGHLNDTQRLYQNGYKEFSYELLQRTSEFCISCHTQVPSKSTPHLPEDKNLVASLSHGAYQNADFYFATRQYDDAVYIYDWLLQLYPESNIRDEDLFEIYYKILIVYSRVKRDPIEAAQALENSLRNPKIPFIVKNEVKNWIEYLLLHSEKLKKIETMGFEDFLVMARDRLEMQLGSRTPPESEPQAPELMWYTGVLYQHLFHATTKEQQATVLYLLAIAEKMIKEPPVQAVSDLFLKKCVEEFSETKISVKCRERLENSFLDH